MPGDFRCQVRLVFGRSTQNVSEKECIDFATGDARIVESRKRCIGEQFGEWFRIDAEICHSSTHYASFSHVRAHVLHI
jgi:hypothetical protein